MDSDGTRFAEISETTSFLHYFSGLPDHRQAGKVDYLASLIAACLPSPDSPATGGAGSNCRQRHAQAISRCTVQLVSAQIRWRYRTKTRPYRERPSNRRAADQADKFRPRHVRLTGHPLCGHDTDSQIRSPTPLVRARQLAEEAAEFRCLVVLMDKRTDHSSGDVPSHRLGRQSKSRVLHHR